MKTVAGFLQHLLGSVYSVFSNSFKKDLFLPCCEVVIMEGRRCVMLCLLCGHSISVPRMHLQFRKYNFPLNQNVTSADTEVIHVILS